MSNRLLNKPRHPAQFAADIVERAIATDGEQFLQTRQHMLSWWQLSLLDIKAFLILVALAVGGLLFLLTRVVCIVVLRIVRHAQTAGSKQKHA